VCAILRLLLWVLLIVRNHEKSSSEAFLPGTIRREVSFEQPRKRACPSSFSLSSSPNNDYPVGTSDDRRNESLEQGHHPLWSLNLNLDSLAKAGAGSRAQELLRRIHALYTEGYYEVSPDIVSYNSVLKAWKEDEQPEAALELLETMIRNEREEEDELSFDASGDENKIIRVDVISFNTVIAAFANQGNYGKALDLLRKMQKSNNNRATSRDPTGIKNDYEEEEFDDYYYPDPDTITYNIVLYSLAQSDDLGTAAQAENLLREMMMRKEHTGMSVVDTRSFNTVLYAWSREGEKKDSSKTRPTTGVAGNDTVKTAAARTRPNRPVSVQMAAKRAEDLLTIMEELFEAGNSNVRPDVYSYTTTIQCWAKCSSINSKESNRPRSDTDSSSSSSFKAQEILNRMIERGLQPNKLTYTSLMNALARARQPERAEGVLRQMTISSNYQPDTVAYSSIIDAWAKISSKDKPEAASKAMQILETMKKKASLGMGPTATTYTSVLTALAKSGTRDACDQALNLLQDMETEYAALHAVAPGDSAANGDDKWSMRPTNIHYNCVLNAYARSSRSDKAIQAQKLMTVMENHSRLDCRPDTISYK
jgi:pentatricopeptide repeat protein